jgi:hypothetical protein
MLIGGYEKNPLVRLAAPNTSRERALRTGVQTEFCVTAANLFSKQATHHEAAGKGRPKARRGEGRSPVAAPANVGVERWYFCGHGV